MKYEKKSKNTLLKLYGLKKLAPQDELRTEQRQRQCYQGYGFQLKNNVLLCIHVTYTKVFITGHAHGDKLSLIYKKEKTKVFLLCCFKK